MGGLRSGPRPRTRRGETTSRRRGYHRGPHVRWGRAGATGICALEAGSARRSPSAPPSRPAGHTTWIGWPPGRQTSTMRFAGGWATSSSSSTVRARRSCTSRPLTALREFESAKIYEELGEFEKARESYEYALVAWRDADPELRPRIEAAREGLADCRSRSAAKLPEEAYRAWVSRAQNRSSIPSRT